MVVFPGVVRLKTRKQEYSAGLLAKVIGNNTVKGGSIEKNRDLWKVREVFHRRAPKCTLMT
jgi:hypothetical protein